MEIKVTLPKWHTDSKGLWLSLLVDKDHTAMVRHFTQTATDKPFLASIKPFRKKRSLDANAYFWTLCGKLSACIRIPPEEIYRELIKSVGDNYDIVPIRNDAVERWVKNWESHGIGWVCENLGSSKIDGYSNIINYAGSSTYDTAQMSRLISLIVDECKEQGIETATPEELSRMVEEWNGR